MKKPTGKQLVDELREVHAQSSKLVEDLDATSSVDDYLELRAQIGELSARFDVVNNQLAAEMGMSSAKARILRYLQMHVGEIVRGDRLAGVAGIDAFARRVRELRSEGWAISSLESHEELRPGEYVLASLDPDSQIIDDDTTARGIRESSNPPARKIEALLVAIAPRAADRELIALAVGRKVVNRAIADALDQGLVEVIQGETGLNRLCLRQDS